MNLSVVFCVVLISSTFSFPVDDVTKPAQEDVDTDVQDTKPQKSSVFEDHVFLRKKRDDGSKPQTNEIKNGIVIDDHLLNHVPTGPTESPPTSNSKSIEENIKIPNEPQRIPERKSESSTNTDNVSKNYVFEDHVIMRKRSPEKQQDAEETATKESLNVQNNDQKTSYIFEDNFILRKRRSDNDGDTVIEDNIILSADPKDGDTKNDSDIKTTADNKQSIIIDDHLIRKRRSGARSGIFEDHVMLRTGSEEPTPNDNTVKPVSDTKSNVYEDNVMFRKRRDVQNYVFEDNIMMREDPSDDGTKKPQTGSTDQSMAEKSGAVYGDNIMLRKKRESTNSVAEDNIMMRKNPDDTGISIPSTSTNASLAQEDIVNSVVIEDHFLRRRRSDPVIQDDIAMLAVPEDDDNRQSTAQQSKQMSIIIDDHLIRKRRSDSIIEDDIVMSQQPVDTDSPQIGATKAPVPKSKHNLIVIEDHLIRKRSGDIPRSANLNNDSVFEDDIIMRKNSDEGVQSQPVANLMPGQAKQELIVIEDHLLR